MVDKIRVGWCEHSVSVVGGAEMSTQALINNAPDNVEIVLCPANKRPKTEDIDVFVIQNCVTYKKQWIEELSMKPVIKQIRDPWYAGSPTLRRWLLDNSEVLIFSSFMQYTQFSYHIQNSRKFRVIPVPIQLDDFRLAAKNSTERHGTIFAGRTDTFKGMHSVIDWALKNKEPLNVVVDTRCVGGSFDIHELPPYIKFLGKVPYNEMPELMAKHKKYIALPMWPEAFGRTVAEAWAAGCELVLNENVGAKEWIENSPMRLGFDGPIFEFWDIVQEVVNG